MYWIVILDCIEFPRSEGHGIGFAMFVGLEKDRIESKTGDIGFDSGKKVGI